MPRHRTNSLAFSCIYLDHFMFTHFTKLKFFIFVVVVESIFWRLWGSHVVQSNTKIPIWKCTRTEFSRFYVCSLLLLREKIGQTKWQRWTFSEHQTSCTHLFIRWRLVSLWNIFKIIVNNLINSNVKLIDRKHPLVRVSIPLFQGKQNDEIIVPCKPTSKNFDVRLIQEGNNGVI